MVVKAKDILASDTLMYEEYDRLTALEDAEVLNSPMGQSVCIETLFGKLYMRPDSTIMVSRYIPAE